MFTPDVMCVDIHCLFVYSGHSELIVRGRSLRLDRSRESVSGHLTPELLT